MQNNFAWKKKETKWKPCTHPLLESGKIMLNITAPHFTREKVCISSEACLQLEFPLMLPPSQQKMSKPICVTLGFVSADEHNSVGVENLIQKSFVLHVDVETPGPQTTAMVLYSPVPAKCNKVFIKKRGIDIAEKKWKKESEGLRWEQIRRQLHNMAVLDTQARATCVEVFGCSPVSVSESSVSPISFLYAISSSRDQSAPMNKYVHRIVENYSICTIRGKLE